MSQLPGRLEGYAAIVLWGAMALSPLRRIMEADMFLHMLFQFPALVLGGYWWASRLPTGMRRAMGRGDPYGIGGLLATSLILMFWMIPRALDLVLVNAAMEGAKFASLMLAGMLIRLSWHRAGLIVQGVFAGNVLPMMMVVGWLYVAAPVRICNSYLTSEQMDTGTGLIVLAILGGLCWLGTFFFSLRPTNRQAELTAF